jgi:hypothetical protein
LTQLRAVLVGAADYGLRNDVTAHAVEPGLALDMQSEVDIVGIAPLAAVGLRMRCRNSS